MSKIRLEVGLHTIAVDGNGGRRIIYIARITTHSQYGSNGHPQFIIDIDSGIEVVRAWYFPREKLFVVQGACPPDEYDPTQPQFEPLKDKEKKIELEKILADTFYIG